MEKSLNPLRDIVRQLAVGRNCSADCKYYMLEEGNPMLPVSGDVEIFGAPYWESCKLERALMDALEKQTPKKPVIDLNKSLRDRCPSCGSVIFTLYEDESKFPHCQWCGQKLDWGE